MLAAFAREFKSLFRNIKSVVCIALFAMASGILLVVNNFYYTYAGIEAVLSSVSLVAALLIPFVASSVISKDRRKESAELLASLPLTKFQILISKFLAVFAFFMIPTAIIAIYPVVLVINGQSGFGMSYPAIFVFIILEAFFIALGMMMSALFKRTWAAMLATYLTVVLCFTLGVVAVAMPDSAIAGLIFFISLALVLGVLVYLATKRLPHSIAVAAIGAIVPTVLYFALPYTLEGSIRKFLRFISPFRHFDTTVFGLFDLSSIFFYITLSALFLWISLQVMQRGARVKNKPRKPANAKSSAIAIAVIALVLCVNITVCSLPSIYTNLDMSKNRIYTVSDETKEFLSSLDEDITLYLINSMGTEEKVKSYIQRYSELSSRLSLVEVNTAEDTELAEELGVDSSVAMYSMVVKSDKRQKLLSSEEYFTYEHPELGYMTPTQYEYYVSYYAQLLEQYSQYSQSDSSTYSQIQSAYVSLMTESKLCFKPEEAIGSAIEYVTAEYIPTIYFLAGHGEKNTSSNPLNIKEITEIPADAGLIIINSPAEDFTEAEVQMLLSYTEGKGRLLVLSNEANLSMPNFTRLMACYGVTAEEEIISVDDSATLNAAINTDIISASSSSVKLTGASSLKANEGIDAYSLLTVEAPKATEDTSTETEGSEDGGADTTQATETEKKTVAMLVYQNAVPKFAWITGADSFNVSVSDMSDEEYNEYITLMSLLSTTASGMKRSFETEVAYPVPKEYANETLTLDDGDTTWAGVIFIAIVPLSIVGIAFISLYSRKKRSEAVVVE